MENQKERKYKSMPYNKMGHFDRFNFFTPIQEVGRCWEWTGGKNERGYGYINREGKRMSAHRYSYEQFKCHIPEGLLIRHTCDNPSCVNPDHLLTGTYQDNNNDMMERKRARLGGKWGVRFKNLKPKQVIEIFKSQETKKVLRERYGITYNTIYKIKKRHSHIKVTQGLTSYPNL